MKAGTLYGVSLGPGDPGLLTRRALELLQAADTVFHAGVIKADGGQRSYAGRLLLELGLPAGKLQVLSIPMAADRRVAEAAYEDAFQRLQAACLAGARVVFACEGDIAFYSTFARLIGRARRVGLPIEMVSGVSSFLLAGSAAAQVLATGSERLAVLPLLRDTEELLQVMKHFDTVVLLKVQAVAAEVASLAASRGLGFIYGEHLGSPEAFLTQDPADLSGRPIPYLSLIIVRRSAE